MEEQRKILTRPRTQRYVYQREASALLFGVALLLRALQRVHFIVVVVVVEEEEEEEERQEGRLLVCLGCWLAVMSFMMDDLKDKLRNVVCSSNVAAHLKQPMGG